MVKLYEFVSTTRIALATIWQNGATTMKMSGRYAALVGSMEKPSIPSTIHRVMKEILNIDMFPPRTIHSKIYDQKHPKVNCNTQGVSKKVAIRILRVMSHPLLEATSSGL